MQFNFPIFEQLCPSWDAVTHLGRRLENPRGALILDMEVPAQGVYYVKEGQVDTVLYTLEGPEKVLYGIGTGSVFGIGPIAGRRRGRSASVVNCVGAVGRSFST